MSLQDTVDAYSKLLRAWQLAILRFAVTLDSADRLNALALAAEVDRIGGQRTEASLQFFRRTSVEVCSAILGEPDDADAIMVRFHREIEDPHLKRAFAAAVSLAPADAVPVKKCSKVGTDLFLGSPPRKARA